MGNGGIRNSCKLLLWNKPPQNLEVQTVIISLMVSVDWEFRKGSTWQSRLTVSGAFAVTVARARVARG